MPRPSFQPGSEQQRMVKTMAAVGMRHEDIAIVLEITPKTLRKHFRQELTLGSIEANVKVGQTLFAMAVSGRHLGASIYWDRTRGLARRRLGETGSQPMAPPHIIIRTDPEDKTHTERDGTKPIEGAMNL